MESPLIARGTGYQDDKTFDGYTVIAEPLPTRESRIFHGPTPGSGCDYGSHSLKLAHREGGWTGSKAGEALYILLEHGGGRRVVAFPNFYSSGAVSIEATILAMDERTQYAFLHSISGMVEDAAHYAARDTRNEWATAFCEGRIRKSRAKQGRRTVQIEARAPQIQAA